MDVEVDDKKMVEKQKEEVLFAFDKEKKTVAAVKGVDDRVFEQTFCKAHTQVRHYKWICFILRADT